MRSRSKSAALLAAAVSVVLTASACGGGDKRGGDGEGTSSAKANAAVDAVVNTSDKKGGTLVYEAADVPDSLDPGNTYYGYVFNLSRLYARPLTTFAPAPGQDGNKVVPDLAESLGTPSNGGKTWTYKLRAGLKYDDGTPITSKDVKHAIERSNFARDVHSQGPNYLATYLVDNKKPYQGPYKDKGATGLQSIQTPDERTIVFNLKQPFADFDYLLASPQSAPVPRAKDTGAKYVENIVSSGSYKFEKYEINEEAVLVRNEHWDAKTDPLRKQLPDKIVIRFKVNQETIDRNLMAGKTHVDLVGGGVTSQSQSKLLRGKQDPNTDNAMAGGRLAYMAINTKVAPFDKVECRQAVQYAVDKASVQTALGGEVRGEIANTFLPPDVPGWQDFNLYKSEGDKGDPAKAKELLKACGSNVSTTLSARSDRPGEVDAATAIQASLKKAGITVKIEQYPSGKYFSDYAGVPKFTEKNKIGLMMMQWGYDWPTGFGYLQQVVNGKAIGQSGNTNLSQLDDPEINKLLDTAIANTDEAARNKAYGEVDKKVMEQAVVVPLTYFKVLHYRSPELTNVVVSAAWSGQYDYLNLGLK